MNFPENCFALDLNKNDARHINFKSLDCIEESSDWAFADLKRSDTTYITHGYHRYPAKFIPHVARRLIEENSNVGDNVLDPFCGCGTTVVESIVAKRISYGFDINPVAITISRAKSQCIDPIRITEAFQRIQNTLNCYPVTPPSHERVRYWFYDEQIEQLSMLLNSITDIPALDLRLFFLCGFSNILKNCSIWKQKSNKPTRDLKKTIPDVMRAFNRQIRLMMRGNLAYWELIKKINGSCLGTAQIRCGDSRELPLNNNSVDLVVTSPPYVTSYEYGDLHQLSMLWLEDLHDLRQFRSKFIGSSVLNDYQRNKLSSDNDINLMCSPIADEICLQLMQQNKKKHFEVRHYFQCMFEIWQELHRVIRHGGVVSIVIGNTKFQEIEITNAEVFIEQLQSLGFLMKNVIKRRIPSKNLPSTRDRLTGRFASVSATNMNLVYPTEYILIAEKQ